MLVYKRRAGQGIVFDGLLRITVQELAPDVWLSIESQPLGVSPTIFASSSRTEGRVTLGIRFPLSLHEDGEITRVTTGTADDLERQLTLVKRPGEVVDIDGIRIEIAELDGGDHHGKPLLHLDAPGLNDRVDLAVLTKYSYAVDIATAAAQSVRIFRTEVWSPAAESNEEAVQWTSEKMRSLERRSTKTA